MTQVTDLIAAITITMKTGHDVYSKEEVITEILKIEERLNQISLENEANEEGSGNRSILDDEVIYGESRKLIKEMIKDVVEDEDNYSVSIGSENRIEVEFTASVTQLTEDILDELKDIL